MNTKLFAALALYLAATFNAEAQIWSPSTATSSTDVIYRSGTVGISNVSGVTNPVPTGGLFATYGGDAVFIIIVGRAVSPFYKPLLCL